MRHCTLNHPQCGRGEGQRLPSRVLNIEKNRVFLYERKKNELARYACLSHRWGPPGDASMLCTLKDTIACHKDEIPWQLLPRNFQDAISFARQLGLSWIWIDSLCIIQDDPLDWIKEAGQMASIYQNAYVTLGATRASCSSKGLFNREAERIRSSIETELRLQADGHEATIYIGAPMSHVPQYPRPMESHEDSPFPLLGRAWVYQERLLSARFLHFAPHELNWECRESFECECGNYIFDPDAKDSKIRSHLSDQSLASNDGERHSIWRWLVGRYSNLNITYGKDVFPALAGLAQRWEVHGTDEYLAGLWRSSFIHGLLWSTDDWKIEGERPFPWRAPTWSWASVIKTPISYGHGFSTAQVHADIVDVKCLSAGPDMKGEISSAHLILSAKHLRGGVFYLDKSENGEVESKVLFSHFRCVLSIKTKDGLYSPSPGFSPDIPTCTKLPPSAVKVLMIADMKSNGGTVDRVFLVLKKLDGDPDTYERLGTIRLNMNQFCIEALGEAIDLVGPDLNPREKVKEASYKMTRDLFREFEEQPMQSFRIV